MNDYDPEQYFAPRTSGLGCDYFERERRRRLLTTIGRWLAAFAIVAIVGFYLMGS
jgi:hypothetical protein